MPSSASKSDRSHNIKSLKELIAYGIVHREAYMETPLRVEYSLTESGQELVPLIEAIVTWGGWFEKSEQALQRKSVWTEKRLDGKKLPLERFLVFWRKL